MPMMSPNAVLKRQPTKDSSYGLKHSKTPSHDLCSPWPCCEVQLGVYWYIGTPNSKPPSNNLNDPRYKNASKRWYSVLEARYWRRVVVSFEILHQRLDELRVRLGNKVSTQS